MVLLCPPFLPLLLLFFYGKLPGGKYGGVCHVDAEKELQCLAAGVACRYAAHAIALFLIAEAALHCCRAECANDSACCADTCVFFLWLGAFADKTGGYAVFGAGPPVLVVGIDGVGADAGDFCAGQFLLILNAIPQPHALVERLEGMVLDEGYPVNLDVVDLGSKLHASDDRTDVGAVNADNAVLNLLFLSQRALLAEHFLERSQAF